VRVTLPQPFDVGQLALDAGIIFFIQKELGISWFVMRRGGLAKTCRLFLNQHLLFRHQLLQRRFTHGYFFS
jgi:hypothetical protein